jgi:hypothetical protein
MVPCAQCWKPCTARLGWKNPSAEEQQVRGFVMMVYVACSVLLCSSLRGVPELLSAPTPVTCFESYLFPSQRFLITALVTNRHNKARVSIWVLRFSAPVTTHAAAW